MNPAYPELFRGANTNYVDKPYTLDGRRVWQQCYICGQSISFAKEGGKWTSIGGELIRHKTCEPPPYTGGKL